MKKFKKGQKVWCYNYEQGLFEAEIQDGIVCIGDGMTIITPTGSKIVALIKEMFETKELASHYATAINFKRGWLRREMENNPSDSYRQQISASMESFPEMFI
jgi:hypothetical protein